MVKCNKCNIEVDTLSDHCPLCKNKIKPNKDSTYPLIKTKSTWKFIKKLLLLIVVAASLIVIFLNYTLTPNIRWAIFVVAGLVSMYTVFMGIVQGYKKVLSLLFYLFFLTICLTILWDCIVGYKGWSLNYVLPSMCISYGVFLIVLRFVSYIAFRNHSSYIYIHILFEFIPIILLYMNVTTFKPLAIISGTLGIVNLLILVLFDMSKLKVDLAKRLHI